jgi:hypothetical protein
VLVATHSLTPGKAPLVAVAPHAAEELPSPVTDAPPGDEAPVLVMPAVDVDTLPRATAKPAPHRAPRATTKAPELVRKVDF